MNGCALVDGEFVAPEDARMIPRSATRRSDDLGNESKRLAEWTDLEAYVLLAEPGAGKSWEFEAEGREPGCHYIKAREFANLTPPPEWASLTLFIDGLDEMRADTSARNGSLDEVIRRLSALGNPRFRLSCREADWFMAVDQAALRVVAPNGQLDVLHLDPLNDEEVIELLSRRADRVADPVSFQQQALRNSLDHMLRNPLLLNLLVDAVGTDWPTTVSGVFERACTLMASEQNPVIAVTAAARRMSVDRMLEDAGMLSTALLLAGLDCFVVGGAPSDVASQASIDALPAALGVADAQAVLSSKLFVAEGGRRWYRHRSIAEYLAARVLARRLAPGKPGSVPLSRALALMCGPDGGVVEPLRGLAAWLAALSPPHRVVLVNRDPLGCVLYGDLRAFDLQGKRVVLSALRREADRFVWFRRGNWVSRPFGALGSADMTQELLQLLSSPDRDAAHQSHLDCVLDAVINGEPMQPLVEALEKLIPDESFRDDVRTAALEAWLRQPGVELGRARQWLDGIHAGSIKDSRDELCAHLLAALYPAVLDAAEAVSYLHTTKTKSYIGWYQHFWSTLFFERTPAAALAQAADALVGLPMDASHPHENVHEQLVVARIVAAALEAGGPDAPTERVARWLRLCLDDQGSAGIGRDEAEAIRSWLGQHPNVQKRVVAHEMGQLAPDPQSGAYFFWTCSEVLYGADRPRDWYRWLLQLAAESDFAPLVEHCVVEAAMAVLRSDPAFDVMMDDVEQWIDAHRARWPQAEHWVRRLPGPEPWWSPWYWSIDDQRGKQHRQRVESEERRVRDCERRRAEITPDLSVIATGTARPALMQWLAWVYQDRVSDHHGDTPQERVRSFLGGDLGEAQQAIEGLIKTLDRPDLPSVDDVLRSDLDQRPYYLVAACLLGASLACERDASAPSRWGDDLARRLIAGHLTDGAQSPDWYMQLAQRRPRVVAEVMLAYLRQCLQRRPAQSIHGLWRLAREETLGDLARLVLPPMLKEFPLRARLPQVHHLNTELLPAALRHLPADDLRAIVSQRLQCDTLDSAQRMAWLLAGLRFAPHRRSRELVALARPSAVRRRRLVETLVAQTDHAAPLPDMPAAAFGRFIELFAPMTRPDYPLEAGWVGREHHRRELVRGMISRLAGSTSAAAKDEIDRLRQISALAPWRVVLDAAHFEHVRAARAARFTHATVEQVAQTLAGGTPVNALDLAALTIQCLDDLETRIRGSEANDLDLFWRDPVNGRRVPRIENECRDRLFSLLYPMLQSQSVVLSKESPHAGDKRADLRAQVAVSGRSRLVPIEIKREDHDRVWTAWRDQLDDLYVTHPDAERVGIYLVLWFGHRPKVRQRGDAVPSSAREFERQLQALIPEADRARLTVRVLDLSLRPSSAKPRRRGARSSR